MTRPSLLAIMVLAASLCGCNDLPGRPQAAAEVPRPEQVLSFDALYQENCAGCHGTSGENGPATDLANPEYEALVDDATLRDVIAHGQKGAMMPGFARSSGGMLTDQQVDAIVTGMRSRWFQGNVLQGLNAPSYKAGAAGDPGNGQRVYSNDCARCHGASGGPPGQSGAILNTPFLALISDQTIRTTVIAGRPDLGMPDWRNQVKGYAVTNQDIADVIAWLMSQRLPAREPPSSASAANSGKKNGGM